MAYPQGTALAMGPGDELFKLRLDDRGIVFVVDEHVAMGGGEGAAPGFLFGHGGGGGAAVDEIEILAEHQELHQPAHAQGIGGEAAAHVVVDAPHVGNRGKAGEDGPLELLFRKGLGERAGPEAVAAGCLHRQVQHDLLALAMGRFGQGAGVGRMRQDGHGDRARQAHRPLAVGGPPTEIIDDQGDDGPGLDTAGDQSGQEAEKQTQRPVHRSPIRPKWLFQILDHRLLKAGSPPAMSLTQIFV